MVKWLNLFFSIFKIDGLLDFEECNIVITNASNMEGFVTIEFEELSIYFCFV
jgi:hypothetical protein